MSVEFKVGMTVSLKLTEGVDIKPGDILMPDGTKGTYKANTGDVSAANITERFIALDYDESGIGVIGALPLYASFRASGLTNLAAAAGDPLKVTNNTIVTAASGDFVIGYATVANDSLTTEIAGTTV
jgi:hypothetical protein